MPEVIDDVRTTAEGLGGSPVVVGHSVGGFVMQKYLERNAAPQAC